MSAGGASGFLAGLKRSDREFFFERRETLEYFVKTQRHVAEGIGLRYGSGGESGLVHEQLGVAEHGGEGIVDVGPHLEHVAPESSLGLGGGADLFGFLRAELGLLAGKNFVSEEGGQHRPDFGLATQLENVAVDRVEIAPVAGLNDNGGLAGSRQHPPQVRTSLRTSSLKLAFAFFRWVRRSVGDGQVVGAGGQGAGKILVENGEFDFAVSGVGSLGPGIMVPRPMRGNLAGEGGIAGEDQDGRALHALSFLSLFAFRFSLFAFRFLLVPSAFAFCRGKLRSHWVVSHPLKPPLIWRRSRRGHWAFSGGDGASPVSTGLLLRCAGGFSGRGGSARADRAFLGTVLQGVVDGRS